MNNSSGGSTTFASSAASRGILGDCVSLVARQLESRNAAPGGVSLEDFFESAGTSSRRRRFDANGGE